MLPAESLLVAPDQRLRSCTQGGLCLSSPVCEGDKTRSCTQEASLIGTSKWQKLSLDEGVKEKSLSGTSKLLPSLGDEGNAKTVKLQSYDSSVTMKEALAVLKEAAIDVPTGPTEAPGRRGRDRRRLYGLGPDAVPLRYGLDLPKHCWQIWSWMRMLRSPDIAGDALDLLQRFACDGVRDPSQLRDWRSKLRQHIPRWSKFHWFLE